MSDFRHSCSLLPPSDEKTNCNTCWLACHRSCVLMENLVTVSIITRPAELCLQIHAPVRFTSVFCSCYMDPNPRSYGPIQQLLYTKGLYKVLEFGFLQLKYWKTLNRHFYLEVLKKCLNYLKYEIAK